MLCLSSAALSGCSIYVVNSAATGTLVATPQTVAFGAVSVGQSASIPVSLTNPGAAPVQITQIGLAGQSFAVDEADALPVTVAPGGSYNLHVHFNPTAAGIASGQVTIKSDAATQPANVVQLTGSGMTATAPTPSVSGLTCASGAMTGLGTETCTITLSAAAPSGGFVVRLTSSTEVIALPATVMVPAGATTAAFTAIVSSVGTAQTATLTASSGSVSQTFSLQLNAAVPALTVSATSLTFGSVQVNNTAAAQSVILTSSGTAPVTVNSPLLSGAGFTVSGATFPVMLNPGQAATLSVQFDPATVGAATGQLTITSDSSSRAMAVIGLSGTGTSVPANLTALSCTSSSLTGASSDSCTVTLSNGASSGGFVVSLASSNAAVAVPTTLTVPAGANTARFTAAISSVGTAQSATLTATAGSASKTFTMQLNAAVPTLSVNATNVGFGNVEVNSEATQSVVLTSTGTAPITISAATVTGAGFTLAPVTFPLTMTSGETATLEVSFDPKIAGSANGQVTIISNSSTGNTAVIPLSGTGTPPLVELSWNAPSDPTDPIAGYNVYRAATGTSGFQMLNSPAVPETTYTDNTVRSGETYEYIVESVDQDGVESIPSNLISLTVP